MIWSNRLLTISGSCLTAACLLFDFQRHESLIAKEDLIAKKLKLTQVQVIFRHGARSPLVKIEDFNTTFSESIWDKSILERTLEHADIPAIVKLPNGETCNELLDKVYKEKPILQGGMTVGQLTSVGQEQSYQLGNHLHQEYILKHGLIQPTYTENEISVRSTKLKRTILSAKCVVAGIFGKNQIKETIKIMTRHESNDTLFPNWIYCGRLMERFKFVEKYFSLLPNQEDVFLINEMIGHKNKEKPISFIWIYDLMMCREAHNFPVPEILCKNKDLIERHASEHQAYILGGKNVDAVRMSGGHLLNELCEVLKNSETKNHKHKMNLYSAHDTTINALLMALQQWNKSWPAFSSYLAIELYEDEKDNEFYVRVVYNKTPLFLENNLQNEYIPLQRFLQLTEKYRINDWKSYCKE